MALDYDFGAINDELQKATDCLNVISEYCGNIEDTFINGMQKVWNTKTSHDLVEAVRDKLNDFITQFNQKFPAAITDVVNEANSFLNTQDKDFQNPIEDPGIGTINSLSVNWQAKSPLDAGYRIPDAGDVDNKVQTDLKTNIDNIKDKLQEYSDELRRVVTTELHDNYCSAVSSAVASLLTSAQEVVNTYVNQASSAAAASENVIISHRG